MTRKYRITIVKDEEFFRLSLHPLRYRDALAAGKIDFVSERLFNSETAAVHPATARCRAAYTRVHRTMRGSCRLPLGRL